MKKTHDERLREKMRVAPTGCWEWRGHVTKLGYGAVAYWAGGKHVSDRAHRLAYATWIGPIPRGAHVLHRCDNRRCINPEHLWLGSHAENMRDMAEKGRRLLVNAGERNGRAKLTQKQAEEIRAAYAAGDRSQQSIAEEYGVSQFAVSAIIRRKRYA